MQAEAGRWVGRCGQKWVHYKGKGKLGAPHCLMQAGTLAERWLLRL